MACIGYAGNTEGVISRQASGLSFDFPPGDGATYFAGTEDGLIHKCSVSYNEQYLETYHGHTGPVYRIRCSPFCDRLFLSARYELMYVGRSRCVARISYGLATPIAPKMTPKTTCYTTRARRSH